MITVMIRTEHDIKMFVQRFGMMHLKFYNEGDKLSFTNYSDSIKNLNNKIRDHINIYKEADNEIEAVFVVCDIMRHHKQPDIANVVMVIKNK